MTPANPELSRLSQPSPEPADVEEVTPAGLLEDTLVEEISIDGMCGVY